MPRVLSNGVAASHVAITLDEEDGGRLSVRAIDLSVSTVRVRFSASRPSAPEEVFQPDVARILRSICDGAAHATCAIERPDFCVRVQGLVLEGCTIAISAADGRARRLQLTLHRARGNALAMFRASARADTGLALFTSRILTDPCDRLTSERLFDEMLSQLYLPLVNLNAYLRHVLDGSVAGRGESFSSSVVQLKTRAETLQFAFDRLISEMMVDKFAGEETGLVDSDAA